MPGTMDDIQPKLLAGTFEMPLANGKLTQVGPSPQYTYTGPALVSQDADRGLRLRLFAPGMPMTDFSNRQEAHSLKPGQLIPDSYYYDFEGIDVFGRHWTSNRLWLNPDFSEEITYIQASPSMLRVEVENFEQSTNIAGLRAFVPGLPILPWHEFSKIGETKTSRDRFEHDASGFLWRVRRAADKEGVWINFKAETALEDRSEDLLRALSILAGRNMQPIIDELRLHDRKIIRIHNHLHEPNAARLAPPMKLHGPHQAAHAHAFVLCYLMRASSTSETARERCNLAHKFWMKILRARENSIETAALILSVAIEGVIKEMYASDEFLDPEFLRQAEKAKAILKKTAIEERAMACVLSSLGNASRPRVGDVLRRFVEIGVIGQAHFEAWKTLRNSAAHGETVDNDQGALQLLINHYHLCLDLFYRLLMQFIGYEGSLVDFGADWWPDRQFAAYPTDQLVKPRALPVLDSESAAEQPPAAPSPEEDAPTASQNDQ